MSVLRSCVQSVWSDHDALDLGVRQRLGAVLRVAVGRILLSRISQSQRHDS